MRMIPRPRPGVLRPAVPALALSVLALGLPALPPVPGRSAAAPAAAAATAPACASFATAVRERVNPRTQASSLTLSAAQSHAARALGFTELRDTSLRAAATPAAGTVAVHRLYRAGTGDFFYSTDKNEIARAVAARGYTDQGRVFDASPVARSCLVGVVSYLKGGRHRFVTSAADQAALAAAGWKRERVRFYLRRAAVDPRFTIAIMPDTQQEVLRAGDDRLAQRSRWLVAQRSTLDLRYVLHTGDLVNWDSGDHAQYVRARDGLQPLRAAGVPLSLSIGNHDTAATCPGGSACPNSSAHVAVRRTSTYNRYLGTSGLDQEGAFEPGKVDNTYSVFTAGGRSWLVLHLELWPRRSVVSWAQRVVASHPRHNVLVVTHSYLTAGGAINPTNGGYGDTSGRYLYDHLISRYANVRMVFSGHVGTARHRVDTGVHGNRIDSYLLAMHSDTTNPVRLVEVDTAGGTQRTWVYAPWTKKTYTGAGYADTVRGRSWVR